MNRRIECKYDMYSFSMIAVIECFDSVSVCLLSYLFEMNYIHFLSLLDFS